jgi:hypothetical protein
MHYYFLLNIRGPQPKMPPPLSLLNAFLIPLSFNIPMTAKGKNICWSYDMFVCASAFEFLEKLPDG